MPVITESNGATVIALKTKRRSARAGKRRDALARTIVALWSGFTMFATILLVAALGAFVLRHGILGMGIALAVACAGGWALAGRLIRPRPAAQDDLRAARSNWR